MRRKYGFRGAREWVETGTRGVRCYSNSTLRCIETAAEADFTSSRRSRPSATRTAAAARSCVAGRPPPAPARRGPRPPCGRCRSSGPGAHRSGQFETHREGVLTWMRASATIPNRHRTRIHPWESRGHLNAPTGPGRTWEKIRASSAWSCG